MFTTRTTYRTRYSDTDQMGVVYYGNYARFYEIGRTEMIRDMGYSYKELEETGVFMPVAKVEANYKKPLYYDERITIETSLKKMPAARMEFFHTIYNEAGEVAHTAVVTLVFLSSQTNRPVRVPEYMINALSKLSDLE
ncbi:MAG TPA: thioesterase family protein [Bacteroidales bacterium]|nr:thioesterase family protein [Bacteroidales bacterium]